MEIDFFHKVYISLWSTASLIAIILCFKSRYSIVLFRKIYWEYLLIKWKISTFLIALSAFVLLAPYTGDPTWDYIDASFMSILTFLTAPWSLGILYKSYLKKINWKQTYIAFCFMLFSASWSYDLYLLFRDGYYPITWHANLFASSVIYISAGLFWNLEYIEGRGVVFGFMEDKWPMISQTENFNKILIYAIPFMLIVAGVFVPFLI